MIESINPRFFSHLAQPGSQVLSDFFNIYKNPDPDHRYLASLAYLDRDAEISIAHCDVIAEIEESLACSAHVICRQDWKTCLMPISIGSDVTKASDELLARFFSQELVPLGTVMNHKAPIGVNPEEILSKHCAIFGMWGKEHNTRVVILDPHAEYCKSTSFGQQCVGVEYCDEVVKRFVEDVDGLVEMAKIDLDNDIKVISGHRRETLEKAMAEASSFIELAQYVKDNNMVRLVTEQKTSRPGLEEELLDKLVRAQATADFKKTVSSLGKTETDPETLTEEEETQLKDYHLRKQSVEMPKKYQEEQISEDVVEVRLFTDEEIGRIESLNEKATLHDIPLDFDKVNIYDINLRDIDDPSYKWEVAGKIIEQLFNRAKRHADFRVLVVAEEAQNFLSGGGRANRAAIALERLAREGRKFGVGLLLISQRPAGLQTDVVAQCNTQIIFRLVNPNDLKYIESTAEAASAELLSMLPKLATGSCYIAGVAVPMAMLADIEEYK